MSGVCGNYLERKRKKNEKEKPTNVGQMCGLRMESGERKAKGSLTSKLCCPATIA